MAYNFICLFETEGLFRSKAVTYTVNVIVTWKHVQGRVVVAKGH